MNTRTHLNLSLCGFNLKPLVPNLFFGYFAQYFTTWTSWNNRERLKIVQFIFWGDVLVYVTVVVDLEVPIRKLKDVDGNENTKNNNINEQKHQRYLASRLREPRTAKVITWPWFSRYFSRLPSTWNFLLVFLLHSKFFVGKKESQNHFPVSLKVKEKLGFMVIGGL